MLYRFATCELDERLYHLRRAGRPVEIEPKVFDVLLYLLHHRNQVVSKDELLEKFWPGQIVSETALARCIVAARKAVGDDGTKQAVIETQHGRGYRFVATVTEQSEVSISMSSLDGASSATVTSNGQVSDAILDPLPLPDGQAVNEHEESLTPTPVDAASSPSSASVKTEKIPSRRPWLSLTFVGILLLAGILLAVQHFSRRTPTPESLTPSLQSLSLSDKPSIVILPFLNLTGDPNQEILGDGIAEGMTTALSKLPGLFIISRASAFTYKDKAVHLREVSRELGVRYVVTGSVQKAANDSIRVTAQLIDATTGQLIWAEEYDRPATDIFVVRDDITRKLVTHVAPKITAMEQALLERTYAGNLEAYDYFVRGSFAWQHGGDQEKNAEGRQLCQKAVEIDPSYAHAYACIGFTYWLEWAYLWTSDLQALEQVLAYGQKAAALDDSLSPAHELIGIYYFTKQEYERALTELRRAVELGPNWSSPHSALGATLIAIGRPTEAIPLVEHAVRLNSSHPFWHSSYLATLGNAYRVTRQYDKAIEVFQESLNVDPRGGAFLGLLATYSESGHAELARAMAGELLQKAPQFSLDILRRYSFFYKDPAEFERYLAALREAGLK